MNIFDTITLLRAGYTKKEIEAMKAEETTTAAPAEALRPQEAPVDMPDKGDEPAPASPYPPAQPEEDPRIKELEDQVRALQAKVIQLSSVPTPDPKSDPIMDIANALINGGIEK